VNQRQTYNKVYGQIIDRISRETSSRMSTEVFYKVSHQGLGEIGRQVWVNVAEEQLREIRSLYYNMDYPLKLPNYIYLR
jgi:hypothetical protein